MKYLLLFHGRVVTRTRFDFKLISALPVLLYIMLDLVLAECKIMICSDRGEGLTGINPLRKTSDYTNVLRVL